MNNAAKNSKCLLLNADLSPLRLISWQRAVIWSIKYEDYSNYGIQILSYYQDRMIHASGDKKYPVPSVARTVKFLDLYSKHISFSKYNLFIRDNYTCQYCGDRLSYSQLTLDHIIPKSRTGNNKEQTSWDNVVACCRDCNAQKGNRTPQEANMPTLTRPGKPYFSSKYLPMFRNLTIIEPEWHPYLRNYINENQSSRFCITTQ